MMAGEKLILGFETSGTSQETPGDAEINNPKDPVAYAAKVSFSLILPVHPNICALHSGTQADGAAPIWDTAVS